MDIIVKSKNYEATDRLKAETISKIEHATRFFDRLSSVEVVLREEPNPRIAEPAVVEVTAHAKGQHIRAEGCAEDHRAALDVAVARFERQLARYKARMVDRRHGKGTPGPAVSANGLVAGGDEQSDEIWPQPRIVRTKRFALQPMLPEDAALQLELLDHEFYVFTNSATGDCNVVYRRKDGDLGLIEAGTAASPIH